MTGHEWAYSDLAHAIAHAHPDDIDPDDMPAWAKDAMHWTPQEDE